MHKFISSIIFNHCTINHFECSGGKSRSLDLFSRRTVGWAMDKHSDRHLIINALLMAIWQRQPKGEVLVHGDWSKVEALIRVVIHDQSEPVSLSIKPVS